MPRGIEWLAPFDRALNNVAVADLRQRRDKCASLGELSAKPRIQPAGKKPDVDGVWRRAGFDTSSLELAMSHITVVIGLSHVMRPAIHGLTYDKFGEDEPEATTSGLFKCSPVRARPQRHLE